MAGEDLSVPPRTQGENAALALRHRLHEADGPVNIWDVIRRRGISLALHDFGPEGGDGRYFHKDGKALILVNSAVTPVARQRWTAAHELGHHELHRHTSQTTVIRDDDVFGSKEPAEQAADAFAGNFLAPQAGLETALGEKRQGHIKAEDVVSLMGAFGLSYAATVNRLASYRLITQPHRTKLLADSEGRVMSMLDEAGIDEAKLFPSKQPLSPEYMVHVAKMWEHGFISDVRFEEMLRMTSEQASAYRTRHGIARPELPDFDRSATDKLLEELS